MYPPWPTFTATSTLRFMDNPFRPLNLPAIPLQCCCYYDAVAGRDETLTASNTLSICRIPPHISFLSSERFMARPHFERSTPALTFGFGYSFHRSFKYLPPFERLGRFVVHHPLRWTSYTYLLPRSVRYPSAVHGTFGAPHLNSQAFTL